MRRWITLCEDRTGMHNQRSLINNAAFRRWFAGSKVVDDHGKPLIVYHGTRQDFDVFDVDKTGSTTDSGWFGQGIYLSPDPDEAANYAQMLNNTSNTLHPLGHIMPLYVRALNPFVTDQQSMSGAYVREILDDGHDAIFRVDYSSDKIPREIIIFNPNQIKSAIGNRGTFNPDDPRIQESLKYWLTLCEGRDAPLYHCTRESAALHILQEDAIIASPSSTMLQHGEHVNGVSLTRSWAMAKSFRHATVIFELNQSALTQRYRILPNDYFASSQMADPDDFALTYPDYQRRDQRYAEAEEFVPRTISPLHPVLHAIHVEFRTKRSLERDPTNDIIIEHPKLIVHKQF